MKKFTKVLAAIMLTLAVVCAAGFASYNGNRSQNGENMSNEGTKGHDYVDLGLPSGTLWATCNVGADTPEGYGDYFAWGETTPKTTYDWSTYKYANGDEKKLTKYCKKPDYGNNGFTDKLTMLQVGDDAATANWGKGWRTPTEEQWDELIDNTTSTWTTQNGVEGIRFTASNGRTLFLPAAGIRWGSEFYFDGLDGFYWSSSPYIIYPSNPSKARSFDFISDGTCMRNDHRCDGHSVRAVREN